MSLSPKTIATVTTATVTTATVTVKTATLSTDPALNPCNNGGTCTDGIFADPITGPSYQTLPFSDAWKQLDCDSDGLNKTDTKNPDSDGDGASDGTEVNVDKTDPNDPSSVTTSSVVLEVISTVECKDGIIRCNVGDAQAECDGDRVPNGEDSDPTDGCVYDTSLQRTDSTSDLWNSIDCDSDVLTNIKNQRRVYQHRSNKYVDVINIKR